VISWDSDASNSVGAEYMFISKVDGVSAHRVWPTMPINLKKKLVRQVAKCILQLWELRFSTLGSVYLAKGGNGYEVGPIVEGRFCRAFDGVPRIKDPIDLTEFRGPFSSISSYLASFLRSELRLYSERRDDLVASVDGKERVIESGRKAMEKALRLCDIYPGDKPISNDYKEPITLKLDDFRMSNILINPETGDLKAFIDFENATTAPGWRCARLPFWLDDEYVVEGDGQTVDPGDQGRLREELLDSMRALDKDGSWQRAYEAGRPYREFANHLDGFIGLWGRAWTDRWVDCVFRWLREHPGVGAPSDVEELYPEIQFSW